MDNKTIGVGFCSDIRTAVQSMINRACIVSYGIVKKIPANGVVTVEVSVADNTSGITVMNCVLACLASDALTVNIKPKIDDKVLVLFPDRYAPQMFDKSNNEPIFKDNPAGYDLFSGIAILINQCKTKDYFNIIEAGEGGSLSLKLAYDTDSKKNLFTATIGSNGTAVLKSNNIEIDCKSDNSFTITNGKGTVTVDSNGNITINAGTGLIDIKNTVTSLYNVIGNFIDKLDSGLVVTAGSATAQTITAGQFLDLKTSLGTLLKS